MPSTSSDTHLVWSEHAGHAEPAGREGLHLHAGQHLQSAAAAGQFAVSRHGPPPWCCNSCRSWTPKRRQSRPCTFFLPHILLCPPNLRCSLLDLSDQSFLRPNLAGTEAAAGGPIRHDCALSNMTAQCYRFLQICHGRVHALWQWSSRIVL